MRKIIILSIYLLLLSPAKHICGQAVSKYGPNFSVSSPNGRISVQVRRMPGQKPVYIVRYDDKPIMQPSALGIKREDAEFTQKMNWINTGRVKRVEEKYSMLTAKKSSISYIANERTLRLTNAKGDSMHIVFRVSNDGVAFRYVFPGKTAGIKRIEQELTSFRFFDNTRAWLQPKTEAQSGWEHTNPSYEAHYMMDIAAGTPSPGKNGWVYPAMFKYGDTWMLITEAALGRTYCGTSLQQYSDSNEYKINFPQEPEKYTNGTLYPESALPWDTPWRIITIGSLKTIVESTLGTDLALPAVKMDKDFIKPGRSSWSWIMSKDNFITYDEQKKYIDYAADMHWEYCLIDVQWDKKIGYDKIKDLADYALTKKVGLILWYNSAGDWNTVKYTPKGKLLTHEDRVKEFYLLEQMGIKGIKVDFFSGDGQSMINYYQDILEDAAAHHLLVNFHGATLPRGWHRTYPNLMTTEAVYGYEMITFGQKDADLAPQHMVMSAFARNAFDPMDFTPVNLYGIPNIKRRTSMSFEMATAVIFLSGIQHFAEGPEGMDNVSFTVKEYMQNIPAKWDDVKFIDGYPGQYYIVARRSGQKWYVAGINAGKEEKHIQFKLPFTPNWKRAVSFSTNENGDALTTTYSEANRQAFSTTIKPNDGFVLVFE